MIENTYKLSSDFKLCRLGIVGVRTECNREGCIETLPVHTHVHMHVYSWYVVWSKAEN